MRPERNKRRGGQRIARVLRLLLTCAGLLAVFYCGWVGIQVYGSQKAAAAFGQSSHQASTSQDAQEQIVLNESGAGTERDPARIIGRIEISQVALSVPMTASITKEALLRGAGHVPGTAFPGGLGTMGIAGHRDTFFRPLRRIRPGMQIKVIGPGGAYRYQVDSTEIVNPEEVEVLNIRSRPMLTLVTCYPFNYIGAAPRRFIVHAHLISVAPESE
jgi:sortase A